MQKLLLRSSRARVVSKNDLELRDAQNNHSNGCTTTDIEGANNINRFGAKGRRRPNNIGHHRRTGKLSEFV
ncbi:hypothetical protein V6N13_101642 [Hibiscus sabdariffa]|uniref:Uncharacterized protein n=1 Tax=Hibiscus sabdariffa TaxID=183260 RepID=A0ABR2QM11_9ROSI